MNRITLKDLEILVDRLNRITGHELKPYGPEFKANIGTYYLNGAYGGYELQQVYNDKGGCAKAIDTGYVSKKELFNAIHYFITGIEHNKQNKMEKKMTNAENRLRLD